MATRFTALIATLGVLAIAPAAACAQGALVVPRPPATVTPQPVQSAPAAVPAPVNQGPEASDGEQATPTIQGDDAESDSAYPFPEGLPDFSNPSCELTCQEEWYAYLDGMVQSTWDANGNDANAPGVRAYLEMKWEVEKKIEDKGGDVDTFTEGDASADDGDSSGSDDAPADASSQIQTAAPVAVATNLVVDAISNADPLLKPDPMQGWAIGEYELDLPGWVAAIFDGLGSGGMSDQSQGSSQPDAGGGQYGTAASGAGTDSNGNVCSKATKSEGKVTTCVD